MALGPNQSNAAVGTKAGVDYDVALRQFMLRVYNYMAVGVALTGLVAFLTANWMPLAQVIHGTPLKWLVMLAPLGFILAINFGIQKMQASTVQILFWVFCAVMGLSLSSIFLVFTGTSIARVFFITTGAFAGLSLYGYTTKRDLSAMGKFMVMGLIGLVIAMVVNIFLQSSGLQFAISVLGVLIFAGLTAWDTQRLKETFDENAGQEAISKLALLGALSLYLNFINMFMFLMQLFGQEG